MNRHTRLGCRIGAALLALVMSGLFNEDAGAVEPAGLTSDSASHRFVAVGRLVQRGTTRQGRPRFALLDEHGHVASYVASTPELDLLPLAGQEVGITARSVSLRTDTPYILADQITPLGPATAGTDPGVPTVQYHGPARRDSSVVPAQFQSLDYGDYAEDLPQPFEAMSSVGPVTGNVVEPVPYGSDGYGLPSTCPTCGLGPQPVVPVGCETCGACPCGPPGRIWGRAEYLLWWTRGMSVPALVTTSPAGTARTAAGVLGGNSQILLGQGELLESSRDGGRFRLGTWMDGCQWLGLEGEYFFLNQEGSSDTFQSTGNPILARPFFNVLTNRQDSELVAFPGVVSGSVGVTTSSELHSAAPRFRINLCCEDLNFDPCAVAPFQGFRIDVLLGYRYMRLDESLAIREQLTTTAVGANPSGMFDLRDQFDTENNFHGGEIGMVWEGYRGPWSLEVLGRLALGNNQRDVTINGSTVTTVQNITTTGEGGLLALPSNIGSYRDNTFSMIPGLDATLGYAVTEQMRFTVGYSFLYWTDVARPGQQIDVNVNPNLLPPATNTGPRTPAFVMRDSGLWAQGLSLGLDYRW